MSTKLLNKKERIELLKILEKEFPDAKCSLDFNKPIELLVALILAAQCTDERVNKTTPILFNKYPDVVSLSNAKIDDIKKIIKPCGFYNNKATNILLTSKKIVDKFNSIVPNTMENLTSLYGIGRKSSNIILQECFNKVEGVAVDTHVSRISRKTGLTKETIPLKQEQELIKKIDKIYFSSINHIFVYHGRKYCIARKPKCDICPINHICKKND